MEKIEIGLIIAIIGGTIGLATFLIGRQSAAKKDGERWGKLETDLSYIKDDISRIITTLDKYSDETKADIQKLSSETQASIRRLHKRINEHLRHEHKMNIHNDGEDE